MTTTAVEQHPKDNLLCACAGWRAQSLGAGTAVQHVHCTKQWLDKKYFQYDPNTGISISASFLGAHFLSTSAPLLSSATHQLLNKEHYPNRIQNVLWRFLMEFKVKLSLHRFFFLQCKKTCKIVQTYKLEKLGTFQVCNQPRFMKTMYIQSPKCMSLS